VADTSDLVRAPRLDLVLLSGDFCDALVAGDRVAAQRLVDFAVADDLFIDDPDDREFYALRRDQVRRDSSWAAWSLRAVVLREAQVMIGYVNFHGPPGVNDTGTAGAAEVGYTIFAGYRGRGFATEVARAMLDWARREHGVTHFISGVAADNLPSLRVNEKLGFVPTGQVVDGELIFELLFPER
jgi:[ribosomal protein S5]-alanine N-acetyltransferase